MSSGFLFYPLLRHRIDDLDEHGGFGPSLFYMRDVMESTNYSRPGKRLLPWFVTSQIAVILGGMWVMIEIALRFERGD